MYNMVHDVEINPNDQRMRVLACAIPKPITALFRFPIIVSSDLPDHSRTPPTAFPSAVSRCYGTCT